MRVLLSTWKPWTKIGISLQHRVDMAKAVRAELCIKGTNGGSLYGPSTWAIFLVPPYKGKSNDDLELLCKAQDPPIPVPMWCYIYLSNPHGSADAINRALDRWNSKDVFFDIEGTSKNYPQNTGPFLRTLGDSRARYWLQSYRRPDYHPEIQWEKLLTYKDSNGNYIIHGLSPQAYPLQSQDFVADFERMIKVYDELLDKVDRPEMPWFPTLPTFTQSGWTPTAEAMRDGVDYLANTLGDRLKGLNFWRQYFLFTPEYDDMLAYILSIYPEEPEPEPVVSQAVYIHDHLHPWAVSEGYDGPDPDVA
jgi:hypothetical protein